MKRPPPYFPSTPYKGVRIQLKITLQFPNNMGSLDDQEMADAFGDVLNEARKLTFGDHSVDWIVELLSEHKQIQVCWVPPDGSGAPPRYAWRTRR